MNPPFTAEQFFDVFVRYNTSVWPAQAVLLLLAVLAVALAFGHRAWHGRTVGGVLAFLWIWMGAVYHWTFFSTINPAARFFGALFVLEGLLFLWMAARRQGIALRPGLDPPGLAGGALVAYALVAYPLLGVAWGHTYPANPTFGLPCPTTIFTMGLLLWVRDRVPWGLLVIPALWSVVGLSAVRLFGVLEDAMLPVAAIGGGALVLWSNRRSRDARGQHAQT